MRTTVTLLAVAALLTLGTGSVVATSMEDPTANSPEELPANHTVDVVNPDAIDDAQVDRAIETAWANDTVRGYFADDPAIHFEVWAPELRDDAVHVEVAPNDAPDETRVVATVDLNRHRVTSIEEPVTLNVTSATSMQFDDGSIKEVENGEEIVYETNLTVKSADQADRLRIDARTLDREGDGTFSVEVDDEVSTAAFGIGLQTAHLIP